MNAAVASPSTRAERAAVRAYLATGSVKAAAHQLARSEQTIKNTLARARRRHRVQTTAQLVAVLGPALAEAE